MAGIGERVFEIELMKGSQSVQAITALAACNILSVMTGPSNLKGNMKLDSLGNYFDFLAMTERNTNLDVRFKLSPRMHNFLHRIKKFRSIVRSKPGASNRTNEYTISENGFCPCYSN